MPSPAGSSGRATGWQAPDTLPLRDVVPENRRRIYDARRALPLKYLLPGLVFLLVFQVFIFGYTAYIAFTKAVTELEQLWRAVPSQLLSVNSQLKKKKGKS